jgi:branched-chain amino acid transport system substrate-binding protein
VACALLAASIPRSISAESLSTSATTARLCVSVPGTDIAELSVGVYHAVLLATERFRPRLAGTGIRLADPLLLDYTNSDSSSEVRNAHTCIRRLDTVAYIGPINSGVATSSEPILNRAGMATLSPANTSLPLTDPRFRRTQEPATYAHTIPFVTYYRMVPNDLLQGTAAAIFLRKALRRKSYYLVDDGSGYGVPAAGAMNQQARALHEAEVGAAHMDSGPSVSRIADQIVSVAPDVVYCGGHDHSAALAHALDARGFRGIFFTMDAALDPSWSKVAGPIQHAYVTNPGLDANHAAGWFQRAFAARFHAATQVYDAYAYDAATAALRALYTAAVHNQLTGSVAQRRRAVIGYVRRTCFRGASGSVSFDRNGDPISSSMSVYALRLGSWQLVGVVNLGRSPRCG